MIYHFQRKGDKMDYTEMLNKMRNPVYMESNNQDSPAQESTDMTQSGQIIRDGNQIGTCKGYGQMNVLRYDMPGKVVRK